MSVLRSLAGGSLLFAATVAFCQSARTDAPAKLQLNQRPLVIRVENPGSTFASTCPVSIVEASFNRPVRYMPAGERRGASDPRLELKILNNSDKDIESLDFSGRIRVKASPYQLDATVVDVPLKLSLKHDMRKSDTSLEALTLSRNAFGFDRLTLDRVHYTDGTTWTRDKDVCTYRSQTDLRQLK